MIPHRTTSLFAIIVFFGLLLLLFSSSSSVDPSASENTVKFGPSRYIPHPKLPSLDAFRFPFRPVAHKPPEQKNSSSGESKWYSDLKWLNPFSSSITLDEQRTVLPPLVERPFIYTFYEADEKNDEERQKADGQLLLTWRRAWYAQGFWPIVLSRAEAMNNPLYELIQHRTVDPSLEADLIKWLAWGNMGTGLLSDWRCFPMARSDDELLTYLRRGTIRTHITRFERLDNGLFAGENPIINDAIKAALNAATERSKSILDSIPPEFFRVEQSHALAYYHSSAITTYYPELAEKYDSSITGGRLALTELINSHLHLTFLNSFPSGLQVLKPLPSHTTALVEPAMHLARSLILCPSSDLPNSCPPNRQTCPVCAASSTPISIFQPQAFRNSSTVYTIGAVPHPYTLISLQHGSAEVSPRYVRRETPRDAWVSEVTKDLLGPERGGPSRVVVFKEAVAGAAAVSRTFWMTVENFPAQPGEDLPSSLLDEIEWHFGFKIPRAKAKDDPGSDLTKPSGDTLQREYDTIARAREVLRSKESNRIGIRDVAEAWNLADTEVWRFVRAYRSVLNVVSFLVAWPKLTIPSS